VDFRDVAFSVETIKVVDWQRYGVAMISRLLKNIGLFCKISSFLEGSFAKENHNFQEPTNHSHPIFIKTNPTVICCTADDVVMKLRTGHVFYTWIHVLTHLFN